MRNLIDKVGGRKMCIALGLMATATLFLLLDIGSIDFVKWADFQKWIFIGYAGSNAAGKVVNKMNNGK